MCRCIIVSGAFRQNLQFVFGRGEIFVLKVFILLCPVIISISSFRSNLDSFSICLLYLGSILGKKILVCLNLLVSFVHCSIQSA